MRQTAFLLRSGTALVILLGLCSAGCKPNFSFTSTSSTDWNVNGQRTSTRTKNGMIRKLETAAEIEIQNGQVTKFPKGALVKLQETGGTEPRVAELRENAGSMELWVQENGKFRRGSAEEESWLQHFLEAFNKK